MRHHCFYFLLFWLSLVLIFGVSLNVAIAQVVMNPSANIDFGRIDFADSHNGRVQLGSNGNVSATGFGIAPRNNGNAGLVRITSPDTGTLEVKCSSSGVLSDASASDLNIVNVEIAVNVGVSFGSGIACAGVLPADPLTTTLDMDALGDPEILIGGEVPINNIGSFPADREYNSGDGGSDIRLSITVQ